MDSKNSKKIISVLKVSIFYLILFVSVQINAQDIPASSNGNLTFYLDHSCFSSSNDTTFVEFYLMFYADQFLTIKIDTTVKAEIKITTLIKDSNKKKITKNNWITEAKINNKDDQILNKVIYDKWSEKIIPGNYIVTVEAKDIISGSKGTITKSITVPQINPLVWGVSELKFISNVEKNKTENSQTDDKIKIIPNPSRRYGILIPKLFFYYEIYGLDTTKSS